MRSREVAEAVGCSERYIQKLTKEAVANRKSFIVVKGSSYSFKLVSGSYRGGNGGAIYEYSKVKEVNSKPRKRRSGGSVVDLSSLPKIDFTKSNSKIDVESKLELVKFIRKYDVSVLAVARVYSLESGIKDTTLQRRIQRWLDAFVKSGKRGLADKRGGNRASKIDYELFLAAISKHGHTYTYYSRYAFLEAKRDGKAFDVLAVEKSCSVSYSGFVKYFNRAKSNPEVKAVLQGVDAIDNLVPKFKIRANYPNEIWEIDATTLDVMVKVPVIDGEVNFFRKIESDEYILKRFALIGVVDRYSKARVYTLNRSDTSYSDVRLIEKAINKLGVPEIMKGDNGKNYVSNHFQRVLEDLGITYIAAPPYKGDKKPFVERGFGIMQHNYLFENLPGFIGHNTEDRKKIENQAAGKSLMGKSGVGTQTHIKEKFLWWWDAEHVLDGLIEYMFGDKFKEHKSILSDFKTIDNLHILLGKKYKRKVNFEGVYFNRKYYLNTKLWNYFNIGDEVEVYEEIDNINRVYVKLPNGEFLECVSEDEFEISVEEAKEIKKVYKSKKNRVIKEARKLGKSEQRELSEAVVDGLSKLSTLSKEQVEKVVPKREANNDKYAKLIDIAKKVGYKGVLNEDSKAV